MSPKSTIKFAAKTKPPQKKSDALSVRVADDLVQRIVLEEFGPGSILPSERELQEHYKVSRAVVREAIKSLLARGLISISAGQGSIVGSDVSAPVIDALLLAFLRSQVYAEDLLNTRLLMEPAVAALAAQNATTLQIREMQKLCAIQERVALEGDEATVRNGQDRWGGADARFHKLLAEASQNPVLSILIEVLVGILWHHRLNTGQFPPLDQVAIATSQHRAIADAIAARDADLARQLMVAHLERTRQNLAGQAVMGNRIDRELISPLGPG